MSDGPALTPQWQHINDLLERAKHAPNRVYEAVSYGIIDDTSDVLRQLAKELYEAHRIISVYWDAIDLLGDGPDEEDAAHAMSLIDGIQITAGPIAEAYRIRQAKEVETSHIRLGDTATETAEKQTETTV